MPTLADILGYQKDDETSEENILKYLFEILGEHYGGVEGEVAKWDSSEGLSQTEEGVWGIQEAGQAPTGTRKNPGRPGRAGKFWTASDLAEEYDISDWQNLGSEGDETMGFSKGLMSSKFMTALQDAFKAAPTAEKWGLDRKIGDIEASSERGIGSAREDYLQSELQRRYGGKKLDEKDMLERASYESDIYGLQRQVGRKRRGLQRDYEEDWYGGISNLMKNLG